MHRDAHPRRFSLFSLVFLMLALLPASAQTPTPLTLTFNGTDFQHRWSKSGQHEFTPEGQEDLSRWQDMITLVVKDEVKSAEQLAGFANGLLARYEGAGKILATDSKPMTQNEPAEHLMVAMLPGDSLVEVVFARMVLVDGTGMVYLYARRIYGSNFAEEGSAWINEHGSATALAWSRWQGAPTLPELKALPESD